MFSKSRRGITKSVARRTPPAPSSSYRLGWGIWHFALLRAFVEVHESPGWPLSRLTSLWSISHAVCLNLERGQQDWRGRGNTNLKTSWAHKHDTGFKCADWSGASFKHGVSEAFVPEAAESGDEHETLWCHTPPAGFCLYNPLKCAAENRILHLEIIWEGGRWIWSLLQVIKGRPK